MCVVSCPFGAIGEKSEIAQVLRSIQDGNRVHAELAPSFAGQFGPLVKPESLKTALIQLGFAGVAEVAYGADLAIHDESKKLSLLLAAQPGADDRAFIGTSCCPSWVLAARSHYPELAGNISESFTPMVETAKKIKGYDPLAKIVFIGPCVAKKTECFRPQVAGFVDFVLTFEELAAMFLAKGIDPAQLPSNDRLDEASSAGRAYPIAGNVAKAILDQYQANCSTPIEFNLASPDTLRACLDILNQIEKRQITPPPRLVVGMACPHGCIGGPGTLAPIKRAKAAVEVFAKE
ncbi:MAG TPA: hypothetical protein DCY05_07535 [Spirochaetaceae bacterium]|nr:hypothetical protein [Spirochaetaceae bacterium]